MSVHAYVQIVNIVFHLAYKTFTSSAVISNFIVVPWFEGYTADHSADAAASRRDPCAYTCTYGCAHT